MESRITRFFVDRSPWGCSPLRSCPRLNGNHLMAEDKNIHSIHLQDAISYTAVDDVLAQHQRCVHDCTIVNADVSMDVEVSIFLARPDFACLIITRVAPRTLKREQKYYVCFILMHLYLDIMHIYIYGVCIYI